MKDKILELVKEYFHTHHVKKPYAPGDAIRYAGRVYDEQELVNLVSASLDFWLTSGEWTAKFERGLADYLGVKHCAFVNSGSSANLIAFMALTSPKLGDRRIKRGDEVITAAAGFPTTVAPIIQYGAVPVFVDVELETANIDASQLEAALSSRTKAVMLAHTLGNTFDVQAVKDFCTRNNLWLIEDNCDALGSEYCINGEWRKTGTLGDIGTSSFYPPHHMTTGEGGAVYTNNEQLHRLILSFRDWGRDCWCPSGHDGTCGKRFSQQLGTLPYGYDHKYTYSHFGYNLKATDLQAAIGCAQLEKLSEFVEVRRKNWRHLRDALADCGDVFILPEAQKNSRPSWFGFLLTLRNGVGVKLRNEIVKYLENANIQTRMLFAGNLVRHPCFDEMRTTGTGYRVIGGLENTDAIMNRSFWVGVYPGMSEAMLDFMAEKISGFSRAEQNKARFLE
ncbi:MAG: lipopolysaccharide biosynthesis protein RfbH [Synergistaceae bacterium]|nr:lipopolysaccharide biosynthesis protein RfbH [Synergistaceae bacterium]